MAIGKLKIGEKSSLYGNYVNFVVVFVVLEKY